VTAYGIAVLLVVMGLLLLIGDVLLFMLTRPLLARFSRLAPARRAWAIMGARFAPFGVALLLTFFVALPSWLRHEPPDTGEALSWSLTIAAVMAALPLVTGFRRGLGMFAKTRGHLRAWRRHGRTDGRLRAPFEVVEVGGDDPALCVGGYWKPTIFASSRVIDSLAPEELSAALAHEVSHASARDPLRLLSMGSCPDFLQLLGWDDRWRGTFARACELAADAEATEGDAEVALDLASALIKLSRLRAFGAGGTFGLGVAVSSAFSSRAEIEERVMALTGSTNEHDSSPVPPRPWILAAAAIGTTLAGTLASAQVHEWTEQVGRWLAP